jgi:hypothetical protein
MQEFILRAATFLVWPILASFFGGLAATIAGVFFGESILKFFVSLSGVPIPTMWELGVILGFLSGFLRPVVFTDIQVPRKEREMK